MRVFKRGVIGLGCVVLALSLVTPLASDLHDPSPREPVYSMHPIGWVRKSECRTMIVIDERYQ